MSPTGIRATLIFLAILVAGVLAYPFWRRFEDQRRARVHAIEGTRQDLRNISAGFLALYEVEAFSLSELGGEALEMNGQDMYGQLASSPTALGFAHPSDASARSKALLDPWGRPLHARLTKQGAVLHVILWSNGPNTRDDRGTGDDITLEFDVHPRKSPQENHR